MIFLKKWILPLLAALFFVLITRHFWYDFMIVGDNYMNNSLTKGDLILLQKKARIKHNNIILIDTNQTNIFSSGRLIRCVAVAGDTFLIRNSTTYINRKKIIPKILRKRKIQSQYIFKSDSIEAKELLTKNKIGFNNELSAFGIYSFNTDKKKLRKIGNQNIWSRKQKIVTTKGLHSQKMTPFNRLFYWNKDNFGPIVIPASGMTIKLNRVSFELYRQIILKETGKKLILNGNFVFLDNKKKDSYTFKSDYYFVLNDMRSIPDDSRSFGFICKDQVFGKVVLKLF